MADMTDRKGAAAVGGRLVRPRGVPVPAPLLDETILDILGGSARPLGAYLLGAALRERGRGVPMMSVYRALDRLIIADRIEKVERLSAYRIRDKRQSMLMICAHCGATSAVEAGAARDALADLAQSSAFVVESLALEALGLCRACWSALIEKTSRPKMRPDKPPKA